jgi:protein involved in ribonucleotide reduction
MKKATGYVTYCFQNQIYTVYDADSGIINTHETIHMVKIPKSHLDNNSYQVHSQYVIFKYSYLAIKGKTVSTSKIQFQGYSGQTEINFLILSDIH